MTATAAWPLPRLVSALAKAGWGDLHGRAGGGVRGVLRALCDLLPHGAAVGHVTAPQLADAAGLQERWTRSCLAVLEDAGVITWTRGTIIDGQPRPSLIRVSKRALAALVNTARRQADGRLAQRRSDTAHRIRTTLRARTIYRARKHGPDKQRNPPVRAELQPTLPPPGEVTGTLKRPAPVLTDTGQAIYATVRGNKAPPTGAGRARLARARAAMTAGLASLMPPSGLSDPTTQEPPC